MNVSTFTPLIDQQVSLSRASANPLSKIFKFARKNLKKGIYLLVGIFALVGIYTIFFGNNTPSASKILPMKQSFSVVAKTQTGKLTNGNLKIDVTGAQKAPSLLVQGQKVIARNNKIFLIVNMEISNSYKVPLYMYPVDGFRLIGIDGKKFAPTAHQGNVEIRPESTKSSNVGFVVPETTKKFKVEVGDLNSDKVILEFTLK